MEFQFIWVHCNHNEPFLGRGSKITTNVGYLCCLLLKIKTLPLASYCLNFCFGIQEFSWIKKVCGQVKMVPEFQVLMNKTTCPIVDLFWRHACFPTRIHSNQLLSIFFFHFGVRPPKFDLSRMYPEVCESRDSNDGVIVTDCWYLKAFKLT